MHNNDEPPLADEGAGGEYGPSAPAVHVSACGEYGECFGTSSEGGDQRGKCHL